MIPDLSSVYWQQEFEFHGITEERAMRDQILALWGPEFWLGSSRLTWSSPTRVWLSRYSLLPLAFHLLRQTDVIWTQEGLASTDLVSALLCSIPGVGKWQTFQQAESNPSCPVTGGLRKPLVIRAISTSLQGCEVDFINIDELQLVNLIWCLFTTILLIC